MTSNLASEQIADYGMQLREDEKERYKNKRAVRNHLKKFVNFNSNDFFYSKNEDNEIIEKGTVSRKFKDFVIKPILKVWIILTS